MRICSCACKWFHCCAQSKMNIESLCLKLILPIKAINTVPQSKDTLWQCLSISTDCHLVIFARHKYLAVRIRTFLWTRSYDVDITTILARSKHWLRIIMWYLMAGRDWLGVTRSITSFPDLSYSLSRKTCSHTHKHLLFEDK